MKISHTPLDPSTRIGWARPSQPLKSPTTLTRWAFGAQTAKCTPSESPMRMRMRAERVVDVFVAALAEQVEIEVADDAAVAIRVVDLDRVVARIDHPQAIVGDLVHALEQHLEAARGMPPLHGRRVGARPDQRRLPGVGQHDPDRHAAVGDVRAEKRERIVMAPIGEIVECAPSG